MGKSKSKAHRGENGKSSRELTADPPMTRSWSTCLPVVQARLAKWPGYLVEKSHALHLLRCLTKRKQYLHNWPFRSSELWPSYCQNRRYDHYGTEQFDWEILRLQLDNDSFKGFDEFKRAVEKMFNNSLRCFPIDGTLFEAVNATNTILQKRLGYYNHSMQTVKLKVENITAKRIELLNSHIAERMLLEQDSSQ